MLNHINRFYESFIRHGIGKVMMNIDASFNNILDRIMNAFQIKLVQKKVINGNFVILIPFISLFSGFVVFILFSLGIRTKGNHIIIGFFKICNEFIKGLICLFCFFSHKITFLKWLIPVNQAHFLKRIKSVALVNLGNHIWHFIKLIFRRENQKALNLHS